MINVRYTVYEIVDGVLYERKREIGRFKSYQQAIELISSWNTIFNSRKYIYVIRGITHEECTSNHTGLIE